MISPVHNVQAAKIEGAVSDCLNGFDPNNMPFTTIDKYIARLKADPGWTNAEIIELQTRVIRAVLARQNALS